MAERWRYNNGDHPSTCTCVPCTEARVERARKARADEKPGPLAPILDPLRTFLDRLARAFR